MRVFLQFPLLLLLPLRCKYRNRYPYQCHAWSQSRQYAYQSLSHHVQASKDNNQPRLRRRRLPKSRRPRKGRCPPKNRRPPKDRHLPRGRRLPKGRSPPRGRHLPRGRYPPQGRSLHKSQRVLTRQRAVVHVFLSQREAVLPRDQSDRTAVQQTQVVFQAQV